MLKKELAEFGIVDVDTSKDKIPIIIQSFECNALRESKKIMDFPRVNLVGYHNDTADLAYLTTFSNAVGPSQIHLMVDKKVVFPSPFVEEAKKLGMDVHPYIVQDDHLRLQDNVIDEYRTYQEWGVDYLFTEFPHSGITIFEYFSSAHKQLRVLEQE